MTNIAVQSASNELGHYTIAQLQLGSYTVRVNAPGFKAFVFSRFRRTFLQAGGGSSTIRFAGSRGN
ncbi:MAG: carboxypeptidase regulatory-like domain-containing protein [Bryobacterales bacterium]|nr:carboxypeptidase regulatory-like domain-containing protein [Bryobacterales bacterium]